MPSLLPPFLRRYAGFSLVEAAIVLAIVGIVIGGIWAAAAQVRVAHRVDIISDTIFVAAQGIQNGISISDSISIGGGSTTGVDISGTVSAMGVFPTDWVSGGNIRSPYNNPVQISNFASAPRFDIVVRNLTAKDCTQVIVRISKIAASAGSSGTGANSRTTLGYVSVNGSSNYNTTTFPIPLAQAATACNTSSNQAVFTFGYTRLN